MQGILENISKTSQDVVRKLIYKNIKQAFHETDVQFERLCNLLYAESICYSQCKQEFENILDTLECIEHLLTKYTEQQMQVIGVDKDCSIEFIENKLEQYKLKTNELKEGIADRVRHESYFTSNKTERHLIVPLYKKFLSLTNELGDMLNTLLKGYKALFETIYSSDKELVLNRFNNHFRYVANKIYKSSNALTLFENVGGFSSFEPKLTDIIEAKTAEEYPCHPCFLPSITVNIFKEKFENIYDKPDELSRTIIEDRVDNSDINDFFGSLVISKLLYDAQNGISNPHHRTRGRPPEDFCYIDYVDFIRETIITTCPIKPKKRLERTDSNHFFDWMVACFVSFANFIGDELYGKIASYYRFLEDIGFTPPFGLRHLQQKINDFRLYLREKKKGGFLNMFDGDFTKKWKSKIRRFTPLEKLQEFISEKFMQYRFA